LAEIVTEDKELRR